MFKNIIWDTLGKFSVQIVGFIISIILARILSPAEFGVMGMATVIILFAHIFLDMGFNRAIIQQKEVTPVQYATIFYINTTIAIVLTTACYYLAKPLAAFYNQPLIAPVFRTLSLSFLINGLNLVPAALLYKRLQLKLNSILTLIAAFTSGIIGVIMAYKGFGVWSLVISSLINSSIILILNFIYAGWIPIAEFSIPSIKPLWKYGSRMFASGVLDNLYTRLDTFIIGKIFSVGILGYYARAQSMDNFIRQFSVNSIMGALFPYIAKHQDDRPFLKDLFKRYLHIICFLSVGLSGIFFLTAKPLFIVLFTSKWLYAAELFQLMTVVGFAWPVSSLMCNIIAGVGNSKAFLKLELYKKALFLPVYIFGFIFGLKGFILCIIVASFGGVSVNAAFAGREIALTVMAQIKIISAYLLSGALAVAAAYFIFKLIPYFNNIVSIANLSVLFVGFYLIIGYICRLEGFTTIGKTLRKLNHFLHDKRYKDLPAPI